MKAGIFHNIFTAAAILAVGMATPGVALAQKGQTTLSFKEVLWDFGNIKEADGPVSHTFEFTNTGQNAIVIERVSVSCGCTTPEYSREPVLPGKKGKIKVTYDPSMRPGYFSKDIYVVSNNGKNNDKITVKGDVQGKPRSTEQDFPYLYGDGLRLGTLSANFRYVGQGSTAVQKIGYVNTSSKPVRLAFESDPSDRILSVESPGEICAGCRGEITLRITVPKGNTFGRLNYKVYPVVDGVKQKLAVSITAIATEDFSGARTGQESSATITPTYHNFGKVKKGDRPSHTFILENRGKSPLIVRSVIAQEGIAADLKAGTTVAPGKSVKVKCTLDTSGAAAGTFTRIVTVIFNDPSRPMREVRLAATIEAAR
ncbi:MAG: DUF1573 domain-containing protein [Rikenellaceae bacterium]|nr:DUF1573 domain-containing protein [Rikenellaceae bacterium]